MKATTTRGAKRRWWLVGGLASMAAAGAVVAGLRWRSVPEVRPLGPSSATIVPGVHMLGGLGPSAAYVVETSDGLVLIDTGLDGDAGLLKAEMRGLGLDWSRVVAILLTHAHGDHVGGAGYLKGATKAKVYAGAGDAAVLRAGGPREAFYSTFAMPRHEPRPTPVDVELQGDESLSFGDATFRALALPGHTPGSIGYLMERDGLRVLFAGDVITMLAGEADPHPMGLKPLGTYSAYLAPGYRGDIETFLATLRKLKAIAVPDLVLPGHPASDPTPQSPRLSQARWEAMLDEGLRNLETLRSRREADGADFLDGRPKRLLTGLDYLGDFRGFAVYVLSAGEHSLLIDAPGGPGLAAFLETRRKQGGPEPAPTAVLLTSCGPEATSGLGELVRRHRVQVFAPRAGLEAVKATCPPGTAVLPAESLAGTLALDVKMIPLSGRGLAPAAYLVRRDGKEVLISGRIPILFDREAIAGLTADLSGSRNDALEYLLAVNKLEGLKPDLWLPAVPSNAQNANLYDGEWRHVITNNYRLGRSILDRPR